MSRKPILSEQSKCVNFKKNCYDSIRVIPLHRLRQIGMSNPEYGTREHIEPGVQKETKPPFLFKVFLLNDDYTTMDFVVLVLEQVFQKTPPEATQIMLHVHKNGVGLAGIYTREIAETKIHTVHQLATKSNFPLRCIMERG